MKTPINKTGSYAATMGTALLLMVAVPAGAFAQGSAEASASARIQAETLLITARGQEEIVAALQAQGFTVAEVGSTLLGRIRIVATSELGVREVVMNRRTGEILRDVLVPGSGLAQAGATLGATVAAEARGSGSSSTTGSSTTGSSTTGGNAGASSSVSVGGGGVSVGGGGSIGGSISLGN